MYGRVYTLKFELFQDKFPVFVKNFKQYIDGITDFEGSDTLLKF